MIQRRRISFEAGMLIAAMCGVLVGAIGLHTSVATGGGVRTDRLCGVQFRDGSYRFSASAKGVTAIERMPSGERAGPLVMRFDEPVDFVDFVADTPSQPGLTAELIALDDRGRLVDFDAGPARPGASVTMQVTADEAVIREARFRFGSVGRPAIVRLSQLDIGRSADFCPMSARPGSDPSSNRGASGA